MNGTLIVLSGPSGVGKDSIFQHLLASNTGFKEAITATTRAMRSHEADGVNYFFKTNDEFDKLIENDELLEWTIFDGNRYGTLKRIVEEGIASGDKIVLVIEVDGVTHLYEETKVKDAQKDKDLREMGFEILRFEDNVILNNMNFVIRIIQDKIVELREIHPLPPPAGEIKPQNDEIL